MKRRLKILFGTFGVIISAFLLYYFVSDKDISSVWRGRAPATRPADEGTSPVPGAGFDVAPIRGLEIFQHDKHHRLRAKYTAKRSEKVGEKLYLTDPKVELFLRDGEIITIEAERGIIIASEAAGKWNVRSGLLRAGPPDAGTETGRCGQDSCP
jgi:deoxycytidine triphosphate deaminase